MLSRPHCEKDITHELEREGMSVINAVKDDLQETNEIRKEAENMVEYLKNYVVTLMLSSFLRKKIQIT